VCFTNDCVVWFKTEIPSVDRNPLYLFINTREHTKVQRIFTERCHNYIAKFVCGLVQ